MDKPSAATNVIAGGIAGVCETLVTYPAEFIKTRRQLPQHALSPPSSLILIKSTYQSSGFSGFYAGCQALAVSNAMKAGIRFLAFESCKEHLEHFFPTATPRSRNPAVNILAGLSAGVVESILVVTPGEALKTRIVQNASRSMQENRGLTRTAVMVVRDEGLLALWKGLGPVLCKQGTNSAVRFTTFGFLREDVVQRWPKMEGNLLSTLGLGAISGIVTVYVSMPFDNIKTRMQSSGHGYRGILDCAAQTVRAGGVGAFWRGTSPRLVRLTLSSGITFAVYDQVVRVLRVFPTKQNIQTLSL